MTSRRDFIRKGSLWVAGAAAVALLPEEPIKRIWALGGLPRQRYCWSNMSYNEAWRKVQGSIYAGWRMPLSDDWMFFPVAPS